MFHIDRHRVVHQELHGLGSTQQFRLPGQQVLDLVAGIATRQPAQFPKVLTLLHLGKMLLQSRYDGRLEVRHGHLVFVRRVIQVHLLAIKHHLKGHGGLDKAGVALADDVGKQHHQGQQGDGDGGHAVEPEPALLAVPPLE